MTKPREPEIPTDYLDRVSKKKSNQQDSSVYTSERLKAAPRDLNSAKKQTAAKKNRLPTAKATGTKKRKKRSSPIRKMFKLNWIQRIFWFFFKIGLLLLIIGSVVGFLYLERLDTEISAKFSGKKWQLPARIYARPLQLFEGAKVSADDFAYELSLLPYTEDPNIEKPGSYFRDKNNPSRFAIHSRSFRFWDEEEKSYKLELIFSEDSLLQINAIQDSETPIIFRLEPTEIAGILSESGEDRELVTLDKDVPPLLIDTLLAIEDRNFFNHFGISPKGIARSLVTNLRAGRNIQGASTLTQQLIKNYFLTDERTYKRKLKEMAMALSMELHYSKEEILEAYLNEIWIGQDGNRAIHGFGLGARFFFNRSLKELEPHQMALLVGMLKSPSGFNPRRRVEAATNRRNDVLDVMHQQGLITSDFAAAQKALPLGVTEKISRNKTRYSAFLDGVQFQLRESYREEDLVSEGLKIFTTLDPIVQRKLQDAVKQVLPVLEKKGKIPEGKLEVASVMVNPQLGEVKALIGGRNFNAAGFNRAFNAQRPVGSLIKPFVFLSAITPPNPYTLGTMLIDEHFTYEFDGSEWSPKNYDKKEHGEVPMITALAKSYNLPTARLGLNLGVQNILDDLKKLGLKKSPKPFPSILLGALDLSAFEVAQLYTALASGGFSTPLRFITEVTGASGEALPRKFELDVQQVLNEDEAYLINSALVQVAAVGTAKSLKKEFPDTVLAGKTGTTDDFRDSWFAGYGGNLLNIVWLGRDDNKPIGLSGTSGALKVWKQTAEQIKFKDLIIDKPENIEFYNVDSKTGLLAGESCKTSIKIPMIVGTAPIDYSQCGEVSYDLNEISNFDKTGEFTGGIKLQSLQKDQDTDVVEEQVEEKVSNNSYPQTDIDIAFDSIFANLEEVLPDSNQQIIEKLEQQQDQAFFGEPLQ